MKSNPIQHVVNPYVVGGAIIGLKCQDAIVIGADTLLSYGSLLSIYCAYFRISRHLSI
jgi:20S proteasome alpha/beta subunit